MHIVSCRRGDRGWAFLALAFFELGRKILNKHLEDLFYPSSRSVTDWCTKTEKSVGGRFFCFVRAAGASAPRRGRGNF